MSKALPLCRGDTNDTALEDKQTVVWLEGDSVCLRSDVTSFLIACWAYTATLQDPATQEQAKRKWHNKKGMLLSGGVSDPLCVIHTLWVRFLEKLPHGCQPWIRIGANEARVRLRHALERLGVSDANLYGTHDFRRGHAEDMRKAGCSLAEILKAGQWRSAAFMHYLDEAELDKDLALAVAIGENDD